MNPTELRKLADALEQSDPNYESGARAIINACAYLRQQADAIGRAQPESVAQIIVERDALLSKLQRVVFERDMLVAHGVPQPATQPPPVAAMVRWRSVRTEARIAYDGADHFTDWSAWEPATLDYALAVTDPARNKPEIFQYTPLYGDPTLITAHTGKL